MQRHALDLKSNLLRQHLKQVIMSHSLVPATVFLLALSAVHAAIIDLDVDYMNDAVVDMKTVLNKNTGSLQLYVLPVGQGDCNIIKCPDGQRMIMFDCGSSGGRGTGRSKKGRGMGSWDVKELLRDHLDKITTIIISHPDRDHFNYLQDLFPVDEESGDFLEIEKVIIGSYLNDYNRGSVRYRKTYEWLTKFEDAEKNGVEILSSVSNGQSCMESDSNDDPPCEVPGGLNFCGDKNVKFDILAANVGRTPNQKSIVLKIEHDDGTEDATSFLLSGDMEGTAAKHIAEALDKDLETDIYQISHHGASSQANKEPWLEKIKPRVAFASSGYDYGKYHHPRCMTVHMLLGMNTLDDSKTHKIYCGGYRGERTVEDVDVELYQTSPADNSMCLLWFTSGGDRNAYCYEFQQQAHLSSDHTGGKHAWFWMN